MNTITVNQLDVDRIRNELAGNPDETFALMVARVINGQNYRTCTAFRTTPFPPLTTTTTTTSATTTSATTTSATTTTTTSATTTSATTTSATTATTSTTTSASTGPLTFTTFGNTTTSALGPKIISDVAGSPTYGGLTFILPLPDIKFSDIDVLRVVAVPDANDTCNGGSPRFSIFVDFHDGGSTEDAVVFVQVQTAPGVCPPANDTGDLAGAGGPGDAVGRYNNAAIGGSATGTYSEALALFAAHPAWTVPDIQLIADGYASQTDMKQAFTVTPTIIVSP